MVYLKELETTMQFIENEKNYYAGFRHVIDGCERAHTLKTALWNGGIINDVEKLSYSERIHKAKNKAIEKHKQWVIARLIESKTIHTVESLTETIYNVIFY